MGRFIARLMLSLLPTVSATSCAQTDIHSRWMKPEASPAWAQQAPRADAQAIARFPFPSPNDVNSPRREPPLFARQPEQPLIAAAEVPNMEKHADVQHAAKAPLAAGPVESPRSEVVNAIGSSQGEVNRAVVPATVPESPGDEHSDSQVLTLAELEQLAVSQNPAVAEAAARVQALRGKYLQVGLPPNPTAGYVGSEIGNNGRAGQEGGFVGQRFITGNKLGLNRAVTAQEVQKAERELAALRQRVLTDVQLGYYELLIAQERLATTEKLSKASQQAVEAVEALLKAKEASGTELLQAKVEADTVTILRENARTARLGAWRRLAAIIGNPEMEIARVAGDASKDLPMIDYDSSLTRLLAENPQRGALFAEVERARWAVSRARAEVCPDVDAQASVQRDYASDYTIAGVQIGLPIPIINRNQGGIQQAQGELIAAQHAVNRFDLALNRRLAEVYQQYATAKQQVDRYSEDILPKAEESLRLTAEGYRSGEFSFLQLLTAQRTYFQTNLAYLDALGQMWSASQKIEGLLLSGSLESGLTGQ